MNCKRNEFNFDTKGLLSEIFEKREDKIYNLTKQEKRPNKLQAQLRDKITSAIDNIPDAFTETKKGITTSVENYIEILIETQALENEKFYKSGFSDAIQIFVECLMQNTDNKKNSNF